MRWKQIIRRWWTNKTIRNPAWILIWQEMEKMLVFRKLLIRMRRRFLSGSLKDQLLKSKSSATSSKTSSSVSTATCVKFPINKCASPTSWSPKSSVSKDNPLPNLATFSKTTTTKKSTSHQTTSSNVFWNTLESLIKMQIRCIWALGICILCRWDKRFCRL